jgi:Fe2+ transport system protein FeoA
MIAQNTPNGRTLTTVKPGETVRLVRIHAGQGLVARLAAMGMLPRVEITVVRNSQPGPCVISVRDSKVALGRGMADKIEVS